LHETHSIGPGDRDMRWKDARMALLDLNLLVTLDVLLAEGSVAAAAAKMNLSAPAMSRQLTRIRHLLGDPVFVRAGRGLVPTPRAEALRDRLKALVLDAQGLVQGEKAFNAATLERTFTIRANDGFVGGFGPGLAAIVAAEAPHVRLRFAPQGEEDVASLRDGRVDLDVGVIGAMGPEVRLQALMHDRFVGVVRRGHPLVKGQVTPKRLVAFAHISVSRRGRFTGPFDDALQAHGLSRRVTMAVASFNEALAIARASDHVAVVPGRLTAAGRADLYSFKLPVTTDPLAISLAWHPRFDVDPAHRWIRGCVRAACESSKHRATAKAARA
jgi:DNA-binding transcriptional LysR family regulator